MLYGVKAVGMRTDFFFIRRNNAGIVVVRAIVMMGVVVMLDCSAIASGTAL